MAININGNVTAASVGQLTIQTTLTPSGGNYLGQPAIPLSEVFDAYAILTSDTPVVTGNLTYAVPLGANGVSVQGLNPNPAELKFGTVDLAHAGDIHPNAPTVVFFNPSFPPSNLYLFANITTAVSLTWL